MEKQVKVKFLALILILAVLLCSCNTSRTMGQQHINDSFLVKEISSKNNWYIIYAVRNDSTFKIVSKKEEFINTTCRKIVVGQYYDFALHSHRDNAPVINGVKLAPVNYAHVHCYTYEGNTEICIEPEKGIYSLYNAENLKGLCFIKYSATHK